MILMFAAHPLMAQESSDDISRFSSPMEGVPELFFDARSSSFTHDGKQQVFDGDVIALGSGNVISADKIAFNQGAGTIEADGHIVIISNSQVFTGERLRFFVSTGDFRLDGATMAANDPDQANRISRSILGFSQAEIDFELARQNRIKVIRNSRAQLREASRMAAAAGEKLSADLVDRYALLLEQEDLLGVQENPALARLGNDRRLVYQRRRLYWDKNREELFRRFGGSGVSVAYFQIGGQVIERKGGNDFEMQDALFTSCRCDPGESPAWAVRSQRSQAQIGGYADFRNAVIEIAGIPIFYLPYFRIPLKDTRQSGFLLPVFSHDPVSGTVFSQPVYFDLGPAADVTLAADFFEERGTRISVDARQQIRKNEGWSLNLEGMRDQIWLRELRRREMLSGVFSKGLDIARKNSGVGLVSAKDTTVEPVTNQNALVERLSDGTYWNSVNEDCLSVDPARQAACDFDLKRQLSAPDNLWRGSATWRGLKFLNPRLSLVSSGLIQSDHRYDYDLYLPDDFQSAVLRGRAYPAFHHAGAVLHYDSPDFYAGGGTQLADNIRSSGTFDGEQLPLTLVTQSRLMRLTPDNQRKFPVYGNLRYRHFEIRDFGKEDSFVESSIDSLGGGRWQSIEMRFLAPVSSDSAVKVDQFLDAETRLISARAYEDRSSQESSWRLGVRFQLPLDGLADVSRFLPTRDSSLADSQRMIQHLMNWSVIFATRPSVVRAGPYGSEPLEHGGVPTYFQSDRNQPRTDSTDVDLPEDEQLRPYQTVGLSTSHRWRIFPRGWRMIPADMLDAKVGDSNSGPPARVASARSTADLASQARRELLFALDRPLLGYDDMFGPNGKNRFFNRYSLDDAGHIDLLTLNSGITYDFRKARERSISDELSRESRPWSEPFLDVSTQLGEWGLSSLASYNIYDRVATKVKVNLAPPAMFKTSWSLAYSQDKEVDIDAVGVASYRLVTTRTANVATSIVPWFNIFASLGRRSKDEAAVVEAYETRLGASFDAPSACWGLRFLRTKEFDVPEESAVYLLQLAVTFMGQNRSLPNMSGAILSRMPE